MATTKHLFCSQCKKQFRQSLKCKCEGGKPLSIFQLIERHHQRGVFALEIYEQIKKQGFKMSYQIVAKYMKEAGFDPIREQREIKREETIAYLKTLDNRPYIHVLCKERKVSKSIAMETINEVFGLLVTENRKHTRTHYLKTIRSMETADNGQNRVAEKARLFLKLEYKKSDENYLIQEALKRYQAWEEAKTWPAPRHVIEEAPMLKRKGLIV